MADIIRDHNSLIGPYVPTEERSFPFSLEGSENVKTVGAKIYKVKVHTLYLTKYFKIVINIYLFYFSVQNFDNVFDTQPAIRYTRKTCVNRT